MIDLGDLSHWLTLERLTKTDQRDPYTGNKRHESNEVRMPCFFDATIGKVDMPTIGKKLSVSGMLIVLPDALVNEQDVVTKIEDFRGNVLLERRLTVVRIKQLNDEDGAHHLELYVLDDAA